MPSTLVYDLCRFSSLLTLRPSPDYCRREKSGKGEPVPFVKPKSHLTPCFGVNGFCLWPPTSIKQDSYGDTQWVLRTSPPSPQITSIPTASWAHLDIRKKAVWSFILKCEHNSPQTREGPKMRGEVACGGISSSLTTCITILGQYVEGLFACLLVSSIWEWSWCFGLCRCQSNLEVRLLPYAAALVFYFKAHLHFELTCIAQITLAQNLQKTVSF